MRRVIAVCVVVVVAACGDTTSPDGAIPEGALKMTLVSGGGQEVAVTDTLPNDVIVEITKGGEPLVDQLVDWAVVEAGCGEPFVSTTRTDSTGATGNRIVAGTRAWTVPDLGACELEVRYAMTVSDTVQARVDTIVRYRVTPGTITSDFAGLIFQGYGRDTIADPDRENAVDEYSNFGEYRLTTDCCAHPADTTPGSVGARTLVYDSTGTGVVTVVAGDSVLDRAILTTSDSANGIRTDFRNYGS